MPSGSNSISNCPLCLNQRTVFFFADPRRQYLRCAECHLVFVPAEQHLSVTAEKAVYDLHENSPDEPGYRRFLSRLADPLSDRLALGAEGLDYGCGPGPALPSLLQERGFTMQLYDPLFLDRPEPLTRQYDFITCTEVIEHFRHPRQDFDRLFAMLKPKGFLGIMTKLVIDAEAFARWHYKNDPTHISFFSRLTFRWLAEKYRCTEEFLHKDVVILRLE